MNERSPAGRRPAPKNAAYRRRASAGKAAMFTKRAARPPAHLPAGSARRAAGSADPRTVDRAPKSRRKPQSRARRILSQIGRIALTVFLVGTITGCLVIGVFAIYVFGFVDGTMNFDLNHLNIEYTTIIYAYNENGEPAELQRLHDGTNRIWAKEKEISPHVGNAFIASEDKRFNEHEGVDWRRTFSAFVNMFVDLYGGEVQGGSSITQQLVKNLTGDDEVSPMRKIQEIMRARYLEDKFTKDVILTCYINRVFYGNNCYGIKVASNYYFDKEPSELSIIEAAALTSIVKAPTYYDPYQNPENNKNRREWTARMMYEELGVISESEYKAALEESKNLKLVNRSAESKSAAVQVNSYFVDTLIENVVADLMEEYGYSKAHAESVLYSGGLRIYSTVNQRIQNILETKYKNDSMFKKFPSIKNAKPESAMVVMDYKGHIVGIVGGRGEKKINRGLNRATQSKRQPGSTMKPLGAYAPALEYNLITYSTRTKDYSMTVKMNGKNTLYPVNYGNSRGSGAMVTTQNALMRSLNTVPARVLTNLGFQKSFDFVTKNLGITTLVESAKSAKGDTLTDLSISSLALGGPTYGLTVKEMTAAYATFGNLGKYWKPVTYLKIEDQDKNIVLQQQEEPGRAMGEDTANIMNEMLQTVVRGSSGTGRGAAFGNWPIYGKTGTTSNNKDIMFYGGTPYYIAGVWFGFDTPREMKGISSSHTAAIWKNVMSEIHKNLKLRDFPESSLVSYRRYCTSTGLLATNRCPSTSLGWFKNSYLPTCTVHGGTIRDPVNKPAPVKEAPSTAASSKAASSKASSKAASSKAVSSKAVSSKAVSSKAASSAAASSHAVSSAASSHSAASQPDAGEGD